MIMTIKIEQRKKERDRWMTGEMTVCVCVFKRKVIFMRSEGIGRELREGV